MPEVGMEGQLKLKNAKVLLIGNRWARRAAGLYLAAAGVANLAWSISTWWISPTCSGKYFWYQRRWQAQKRSGTSAAL